MPSSSSSLKVSSSHVCQSCTTRAQSPVQTHAQSSDAASRVETLQRAHVSASQACVHAPSPTHEQKQCICSCNRRLRAAPHLINPPLDTIEQLCLRAIFRKNVAVAEHRPLEKHLWGCRMGFDSRHARHGLCDAMLHRPHAWHLCPRALTCLLHRFTHLHSRPKTHYTPTNVRLHARGAAIMIAGKTPSKLAFNKHVAHHRRRVAPLGFPRMACPCSRAHARIHRARGQASHAEGQIKIQGARRWTHPALRHALKKPTIVRPDSLPGALNPTCPPRPKSELLQCAHSPAEASSGG